MHLWQNDKFTIVTAVKISIFTIRVCRHVDYLKVLKYALSPGHVSFPHIQYKYLREERKKYVYFHQNYMAERPSLRLKITAVARTIYDKYLKYMVRYSGKSSKDRLAKILFIFYTFKYCFVPYYKCVRMIIGVDPVIKIFWILSMAKLKYKHNFQRDENYRYNNQFQEETNPTCHWRINNTIIII